MLIYISYYNSKGELVLTEANNKVVRDEKSYNLDIVYDYKEFPDKISGRCDNCNNSLFKSSVKNFIFLRECSQCGMKKSI